MRSFLLLTLYFGFLAMSDLHSQPANPAPDPIGASMQTYSFRLRPGQDLKQQLDDLIRQQRIGAGVVLTCVGSLTDVTLRLANQEGPSVWHGHFEIVSLVGTLSANGSHLHLSVSDSTGRTLGGHLLAGCKVYTTAELVIGVMPDLTYTREPDSTFGYKELVVRKRKRK
ncbi:DNA-binding protein [Spirosoma taeanense]|uniref:DNA-binding protein n=1 Tax=Spirosoma taeanense TaxID=2735870 RepID=A0A6M5Y8J9_9BACT|nr:PPC domain-containing DNA-binding protein [Spirosoma taeanense]QJW90618.1 DNA-binding protein [Spirosoma taeanense]